MVHKLIRLIEEKTEADSLSRNFFGRALRENLTFVRAQKFINMFIYEHSLVIPPIYVNRDNRSSLDGHLLNYQEPKGAEFRSFIENNTHGNHMIKAGSSRTERGR